jgi:hypothetical protein
MSGVRLISPQSFQETVAGLRRKFVDWVDQNLPRTASETWILTPLYKNPFANNLLLHLTWLKVINDAIKDHGDDLAVITDSIGLAKTIEQLCRSNGLRHQRLGKAWFRVTRAFHDGKSVARFLLDLNELVIRAVLARTILGGNHRRRLHGVRVLVDSFLHDDDLSDDGRFSDRYFPGLLEWYSSRGLKSASYPFVYRVPLNRLPGLYRRMRRSPTLFAPFELFMRANDIAASLQACWSGIWAGDEPITPFYGIEVGPLIKELQPRASLDGFTPLVLAKAPKRMEQSGICPDWIIDWYENQPIDKASVIGFSQMQPPCRVIAMRQYCVLPNWLNMFTTTAEVEAGVAPQEHWVCGRAQADSISIYDSIGDYRIVSALRYAHLYRQQAEEPREERWILVLLTHSFEESLEIIACVMDAARQSPTVFGEIVVKTHPDWKTEEFRRVVEKRWPETIPLRWESKKGDVLFRQSRIIVTAGTSSAVEAVCYGVPVIIIGQAAGLDMNPFENVDRRMWQLTYDVQGLCCAVERWTPTHPLSLSDRMSLGRNIRNAHFEPVTENSMRAFIPERWQSIRATKHVLLSPLASAVPDLPTRRSGNQEQ